MAGVEKEKRAPAALGDVLDSVLSRYGIRKQLREKEALTVWDAAVGEIVARNCRPRSVADGIMVVEAKNNVWMQELSLMRQGIIEKINEILGWDAVKELRFRIVSEEEFAAKTPPIREKTKQKKSEIKIAPKIKREIEDALKGIEDGDLKEALRGLMIRGIRRSGQ